MDTWASSDRFSKVNKTSRRCITMPKNSLDGKFKGILNKNSFLRGRHLYLLKHFWEEKWNIQELDESQRKKLVFTSQLHLILLPDATFFDQVIRGLLFQNSVLYLMFFYNNLFLRQFFILLQFFWKLYRIISKPQSILQKNVYVSSVS